MAYEQQVTVTAKGWTGPFWQERVAGDKSEAEGDYQVTLRELIASPTAVYDVLEKLGRGTFGQVVRCWKKDSNEIVAVKILKSTPSYAKQGQMEVDVLSKLSRLSADEGSFVKAYESFHHHGHICIVFELLHINLYDYLKQSGFEPLPLKYIRPIAQQVLCCLEKLSSLGLVHADLKPENIMLVDPQRFPFKVKVIDFGSAMSKDRTSPSCYLQSRYYRAPEVIMGVTFNEAIDMWSLGCVLAELYLGWPLFPGACEYDQITYICQTLGQLPGNLLRNLNKASRFFNCDPHTRAWSLKPVNQYAQETGLHSKESRKYIFRSLLDMMHITPSQSLDNQESILTSVDRMEFISLLSRMLTMDPSQRISPLAALQTPFITMQHLAMHTNTQTVWEWIQSMAVCHQPRLSTTVPTAASVATHTGGTCILTATPTTPGVLHHNQFQLLNATTAATTTCGTGRPPHIQYNPALPAYPIIPQGRAHLICHVAPSTLGYLPVTTGPHVLATTHQERPAVDHHHHQHQVIHPWIDTRGIPTATVATFPSHQLCTCHVGPAQTVRTQQVILPEQVSSVGHIHANQGGDNSHFTNKVLPLQLPAYHPFSRL